MSGKIILIPHTHWDREWYEPFQRFRARLVRLIDDLLDILRTQDYRFMLDGQTVIIEDYAEIRPNRVEELLQEVRAGRVAIGPWYVLADEWLVGGESLIRNLEYSYSLAQRLDIPLMGAAYLPDQFGHTSAMPQILADLTSLDSVVLWRGVPRDILTVPFVWRSHRESEASVLGVYMPNGYGNVARLPEDYEEFKERVHETVGDLRPFSPVPVYQLMNGSDHLTPQAFVASHVEALREEGVDITLGSVEDFVLALREAIESEGYTPPSFSGEMRSPARAPLLQDTYSARMWIKLWNQRVEDLLCREAEPLSTYLWLYLEREFPSQHLLTAWKWLLRNHPHDSICGCSIDRTHEEMRTRFSWAESIAESIIDSAIEELTEASPTSDTSSILVFNPTNVDTEPLYVEFTQPQEVRVRGVRGPDGRVYPVQKIVSSSDVFMDMTIGLRMARMGLRLLTGRRLTNFYINGAEYYDGDKEGLLELRLIADMEPLGEFDIAEMKQRFVEIIESGRYKKVHLVARRPTQVRYAAALPLPALAFSELRPTEEDPDADSGSQVVTTRDRVTNQFYEVEFNRDGSISLLDKASGQLFDRMHFFEDYGDRGDEYTCSQVGPERAKVKRVRREVLLAGPAIGEIHQELVVEVFAGLDESREKRSGRTQLTIESTFRFYADSPRIDVVTRLTNTAKDHRLRVCFDLPFSSSTTETSTHFGYVVRRGEAEEIPGPEELERTHASYPEHPSPVQPQKRFIRVSDADGVNAVTVYNKGLHEVALVNGERIALTLLRAVGWLSRSDFPERPVHAGPAEETPGAQELGVEYVFHYGFAVHPRELPIVVSADYGDSLAGPILSISLNRRRPPRQILEPIVRLSNRAIRISSLRVRDDGLVVTMYNVTPRPQETEIILPPGRFGRIESILVDGTVRESFDIADNAVTLRFTPRQIRMCRLV